MTLTNRAELRQAVLRELGGRVATSSATTATVLTVAALAHKFGDDNALVNHPIALPSLSGADAQRRINTWDDSAGTMAIDALSADPAEAITVEIYNPGDPTKDDIEDALNRCLAETYRTAWVVLPTVDRELIYSMVNFPWVRKRTDILTMWWRRSPNLLSNEGFELWGDGSSAELPRWVLSGTNAIATRTPSTAAHQAYAVELTASGGVDVELRQSVGLLNLQLRGEEVTASAIIKTAVASAARIGISDGLTTTFSPFHTGGDRYEVLQVTKTLLAGIEDADGNIQGGATDLQMRLRMEENGVATYDQPNLVEDDTIPDQLRDFGSASYRLEDLRASRIDYATTPAVLVPRGRHHGGSLRARGGTVGVGGGIHRGNQIVVATAQPFFPLAADTDVTDAPLEALKAGTLLQLANIFRRGEAQDRWEAVAAKWGPVYHLWREQLIQSPTFNPTRSKAVIRGA